ncbi:hypothetical protein ES706_06749 [subsurface metagenome]
MIEFDPKTLATMDLERLRSYDANLDFYNGLQWLAKDKTGKERPLVLNYAKAAIDKITSFLMRGLKFPCYPAEETEVLQKRVKRAEALLIEVYDQNNLQQLDWETELDAAILGDGCYKVIWDTHERRVKVVSPDVRGLYAWWLGDDLSSLWRVASEYELTQDEVEILYGLKTDKKKVPVIEVWTEKTFALWVNNKLRESKSNPYGFIPFIIFPNYRQPKQFWGTSDVICIIEVQRELNRSVTQLSRILEVSGNPIVVFSGLEEQEIKVGPGKTWFLPDKEAKAYILDFLKGGGIRLHVDYIDLLYRCLHDLSEMPRAAYGGIEKELSGTALNIELGSLVQKVTRKRTIRNSVYHRRTEMILKLAQKFMHEDLTGVSHGVVWGPILPADVVRQAQNEQLLVTAGIHSRRTAMDEMGVKDPEAEFFRWLEERATIREQNIKLPTPSARGGPITRVLESTEIESGEEV